MFFRKNVNKISKVGHRDLFLILDTPLPQDEILVPRFDDPSPCTSKVTG